MQHLHCIRSFYKIIMINTSTPAMVLLHWGHFFEAGHWNKAVNLITFVNTYILHSDMQSMSLLYYLIIFFLYIHHGIGSDVFFSCMFTLVHRIILKVISSVLHVCFLLQCFYVSSKKNAHILLFLSALYVQCFPYVSSKKLPKYCCVHRRQLFL